MNNYRAVDFMPEQRIKRAFKGKREHLAKLNILNVTNILISPYHMVLGIMLLCQIP